MQLNFIFPCVATKTLPRPVLMRDIPNCQTMEELHQKWLVALRGRPTIHPIYAGQVWRRYNDCIRLLPPETKVWIMSAGFGVIPIERRLPAYSCSFNALGNRRDNPINHVPGSLKREWFAHLEQPELDGFTIMALSAHYAQMAVDYINRYADVLITGWPGDIPSSVRVPKVIPCSVTEGPGILRHAETTYRYLSSREFRRLLIDATGLEPPPKSAPPRPPSVPGLFW